MASLRFLWILAIVSGVSISSASGQHFLAAHGNTQILIGTKTLFTMQEQANYQIVSLGRGRAFLIQTPYGDAEYDPGVRVRVLPGGRFSATSINVRGVAVSTSLDDTRWMGIITSTQPLDDVYGAFQWYVGGQPDRTSVRRIGPLAANTPYPLDFRLPVTGEGTYTVHFWSGAAELKQQADF